MKGEAPLRDSIHMYEQSDLFILSAFFRQERQRNSQLTLFNRKAYTEGFTDDCVMVLGTCIGMMVLMAWRLPMRAAYTESFSFFTPVTVLVTHVSRHIRTANQSFFQTCECHLQ